MGDIRHDLTGRRGKDDAGCKMLDGTDQGGAGAYIDRDDGAKKGDNNRD